MSTKRDDPPHRQVRPPINRNRIEPSGVGAKGEKGGDGRAQEVNSKGKEGWCKRVGCCAREGRD